MASSKLLASFFALAFLTSIAVGQDNDRDKGVTLFREGKFAEAISTLEKVVQADDERIALLYLGAAYYKEKNRSKARKAFEASNKIKTENIKPPKTLTDDKNKGFKITKIARAPAPSNMRGNYTYGKTSVAVELLFDGTIGFIFPFSSTVTDWEPSVISAVKMLEFTPSIKNGKNVTSIVILDFEFDRR